MKITCRDQIVNFFIRHNLSDPLLDLEKKIFEICIVWAFEALHLYHLNNFEFPTPKKTCLRMIPIKID